MDTLSSTILLLEDNEILASALAALLAENGYSAVYFAEANGAVEWLKSNKPELIISDIGLPGISGTQFCRLLKQDNSTCAIPVLILSGDKGESTKVEVLKAGAEDYVVKPFSKNELLARIEALLRRCYHGGRMDKLLVSGALTINADTGDISIGDKKISLLPKEYLLLSAFLRRKGHILDYTYLSEAVWGDSAATKHTVKVTISRLKSKLGNYSDCIEPAFGLGYKWVERHIR